MPTNVFIDPITVERINKLHPKIRAEVLQLVKQCYQNGVPIRVVQGARSIPEQQELYDQGRTKPGAIVTYAKPGLSWHNYFLAIDFCLLVDKDNNGTYENISWDLNVDLDHDGQKDWMEVVNIFKAAGYVWGGDWPKPKTDNPHLQKTFGLTIREALAKYNNKEIDADGNLII